MILIFCNSKQFLHFNNFSLFIGKNKLWAGQSKGFVSILQLGKVSQTKVNQHDSSICRESQGKALKKLCHIFPLSVNDFLKLPQKYMYFWRKGVLVEALIINISFNVK